MRIIRVGVMVGGDCRDTRESLFRVIFKMSQQFFRLGKFVLDLVAVSNLADSFVDNLLAGLESFIDHERCRQVRS